MMTLPDPKSRPLVVFTDLDGTLIDHQTYSPAGSMAAVRRLVQAGIPLVFCSSKTFAEQVFIQEQIGILQPFILENGCAAAIPHGFFPPDLYSPSRRQGNWDIVVFAHADVTEIYHLLAPMPEIKGFATTEDAEMSAATGLVSDDLGRARSRWFTETILTKFDEKSRALLDDTLQAYGFCMVKGGRFYTIQSARANKGNAVRWMMEIFCHDASEKPCFAAVGDSPNDIPMLEVVDVPFLVRRFDGQWVSSEIPHLIRLEAAGPAGFTEAVSLLLG